jgi:hypothetical protein
MDEMEQEFVRLPFETCDRRSVAERDSARDGTLRRLLSDAQSEAMLVIEEDVLQCSGEDAAALKRHAEHLSHRAQTYRRIADACVVDATRNTYLVLEHRYAELARREAAKAAGHAGRADKAGRG